MMVRKGNPQKLSKSESGRLGGLARMATGVNIGNTEGRRRGGLNSLATHKRLQTGFITLKEVRKPRRSKYFAEFLGIMYGDGHVDKYQATMTTNAETDIEHAKYVRNLMRKLFGVEPAFTYRKNSKACTITLNSRRVCDFLQQEGLPRGNKITLGLNVPKWISKSRVRIHAFARGLFDTDGCVFLDHHTLKSVLYKNIGIAFASKSPELLKYFTNVLRGLGLRSTQTTPYRVFLRRASDIDVYFRVVGSSNPKHLSRYKQFRRQ